MLMSTTGLSILSGLAGMFGWGLHDFLGGVFAKRIGPFKSFFWSQTAGCIMMLAMGSVLARGMHVSVLAAILIPIGAMLYSAGYLLFFRGFEIGNVSIVAATMNLWAVFTMLFAFAIMGQRLTLTQGVGVLMIIAGATAASLKWSDIRGRTPRLSVGVKETAIGAFFFGIFWNVSQVLSEQIGWLLSTLLVKVGVVVFVLIYSAATRRALDLTAVPARTKYVIVLMGIIETSAVAVVNYGLTVGDAILISPISSALSIVTIALAIIFLKEKVTKLQGLGMLTAIAGIVMTAF